MEQLWEFITGIGSVAGLLTAAFIIWDRAFRDAPFAVITSRPLVPSGMNYQSILFIENPGPRPIILEWQNGDAPGVLMPAVDNSIDGIVKSVVSGRSTLVVDRESTTELILLKPSDYGHLSADQTVTYEIAWRYAQPVMFKAKRYLRGSITKRDLQSMLRENLRGYTQRETDYEED